MHWRDWQTEIKNSKVFIVYGREANLYPISEWIHPGALPIGTGLTDDITQDLPNLDWLVRHLAWMGFRDITILSNVPYKGLNLFYEDYFPRLDIIFRDIPSTNELKQFFKNEENRDLIILSGYTATNADLRHSLLLHRQRNNNISLLSIRGLKFRIGLADIDKGSNEILDFKEKPTDKSQLVNSNIVILNSSRIRDIIDEDSNIWKEIESIKYSNEILELSEIIEIFIKKNIVNTVELTGVEDEPWFQDLSQLETWVKLDYDEFIDNYSHLYIIEK